MSDEPPVSNEPFPVDVRAKAIALVWSTGSFSEATRRMRELYPDRSPSRQLVSRWCSQADPERVAAIAKERTEAFVTTVMESSLRAAERLGDIIDSVPDKEGAIPAGISIDKGLRLLELDRRHHVNEANVGVFIITRDFGPDRDRVLEVEGHVVGEATTED